eukprot:GHVO01070183.1.p1 GENE.GHVO01070183.1~~GHVO01070183.1.p1  ORF type:complete len:350 (+),score=32.33 GHVO01070183.1:320-1369(+)
MKLSEVKKWRTIRDAINNFCDDEFKSIAKASLGKIINGAAKSVWDENDIATGEDAYFEMIARFNYDNLAKHERIMALAKHERRTMDYFFPKEEREKMVEDLLHGDNGVPQYDHVQGTKDYCTKRKAQMIRESKHGADPKMSKEIRKANRNKELIQLTVLARAALMFKERFAEPKANHMEITGRLQRHMDAMAIYWTTHDILFEHYEEWVKMMAGFKTFIQATRDGPSKNGADLDLHNVCFKNSFRTLNSCTKNAKYLKDKFGGKRITQAATEFFELLERQTHPHEYKCAKMAREAEAKAIYKQATAKSADEPPSQSRLTMYKAQSDAKAKSEFSIWGGHTLGCFRSHAC